MKPKVDRTRSATIDLAPELMVASVLVDIAKLDRAVFRSFRAGRHLTDLIEHIRDEEKERFQGYLDRLEDPKLAWDWVREIVRQRKELGSST